MPSPHHPQPHQPDTTNPLPGSFALTLPTEELLEVVRWAERFSPGPMAPFTVTCTFRPGGRRRWVAEEANVRAWIDFSGGSQPESGTVAFHVHFLENAAVAFARETDATLQVNAAARKVEARSAGATLRGGLPPVPARVNDPEVGGGNEVRCPAVAIETAAHALRTVLVSYEEGEDRNIPWPYVTAAFDGATLVLRRDWSEFNREAVEVEIAATGNQHGTVSFYPEVVLRELWISCSEHSDPAVFRFPTEAPDVMVVTSENWGMKVAMGSELVLRYRREIVGILEASGLEVERDDRRDWSPLIATSCNGRQVLVELVRGERLEQSHARISTVVALGLPWTQELASELNSWNDRWIDTKLLFQEGALVVVRDAAVGALEVLPEHIKDVVDKSQILYDVAGALM